MLYARVLHCLELVSSCESLADYAESVTYEELQDHAAQIVDRFANPTVVSKLRNARLQESLKYQHTAGQDTGEGTSSTLLAEGDMVFENAVLFMRDALVLCEFMDAIKDGDSGRIIIILKTLALSYRGSGRTKYAHELLFLMHNLTQIWPKPLRQIILKNWLVNPTGKPNAWVPVDLLQEHMNFWIKTVYKAQGSNASWEWLSMISPCIDILRQLATQVNGTLGSKQGSKHAAPDLANDIQELKRSLREHNVYTFERGRTIDGTKPVVPNIIALGLTQLHGPLNDYNRMFQQLKKRRAMSPLVNNLERAQEVKSDSEGRLQSQAISEDRPETVTTETDSLTTPDTASLESDDGTDSEFSADNESEGEGDENMGSNDSEMLSLETEDDVAFDMDDF